MFLILNKNFIFVNKNRDGKQEKSESKCCIEAYTN